LPAANLHDHTFGDSGAAQVLRSGTAPIVETQAARLYLALRSFLASLLCLIASTSSAPASLRDRRHCFEEDGACPVHSTLLPAFDPLSHGISIRKSA
jgi:hypothetical protein